MCLPSNIIKIIPYTLLMIGLIDLLILLVVSKKRKTKKRNRLILVYIAVLIITIICYWGSTNIKTCKEAQVVNQDTTTTTPTTTTTTTTSTTTTKKVSEDGYVGTTTNGYTITKKNGAYYIDDYLVVNKTYALASNWVPQNTYSKINAEICKNCLDKTTYSNWSKMQSDASAVGLNIYIASGYRSYSYQNGLYNSYLKKDTKAKVDTYSARPGHSEHQSGLAFDLNSVTDAFAATNEGKWIQDNCYLYGFIIRYPKDKSNETGYKYEPWHLRYVGVELANKLYNNGNWITMETYFGIDSKYQ